MAAAGEKPMAIDIEEEELLEQEEEEEPALMGAAMCREREAMPLDSPDVRAPRGHTSRIPAGRLGGRPGHSGDKARRTSKQRSRRRCPIPALTADGAGAVR